MNFTNCIPIWIIVFLEKGPSKLSIKWFKLDPRVSMAINFWPTYFPEQTYLGNPIFLFDIKKLPKL